MNPQETDQPAVTPQAEGAQPAAPEAPTPATELATPAPASEPTAPSPAVESAEPTPAPQATPVSQPVTPQPIAPEGTKEKKGKSWIIILIIILLLLLALFGAIWWTGSKIGGAVDKFTEEFTSEGGSESGSSEGDANSGTVTPIENNPITAADEKMRSELGSFDYTANITSSAMGMDVDTTMNCTFDGPNKIEYCKTELFMGMTQEIYYDWNSGYEYTKTVSPYSFAPVEEGWTKTSVPQGKGMGINISNGTTFTDMKSEAVENGTKYTGKINGFTAATDDSSSMLSNTAMNYEIVINNDGYIDTMTMNLEGVEDMSQSVVVKYSNFGTAGPLTIPSEALNAE